jgi:hypothetical protein
VSASPDREPVVTSMCSGAIRNAVRSRRRDEGGAASPRAPVVPAREERSADAGVPPVDEPRTASLRRHRIAIRLRASEILSVGAHSRCRRVSQPS